MKLRADTNAGLIKRVMRTTALAGLVAPVILGAYTRRAYAACTTNGASVYNPASGDIVSCAGQSINTNFTALDTVSGFSLTLNDSESDASIFVYGDANTITLENGSSIDNPSFFSVGIKIGDGTNVADGNILNISNSIITPKFAGLQLDGATNTEVTLLDSSILGSFGYTGGIYILDGSDNNITITETNASNSVASVSGAVGIGLYNTTGNNFTLYQHANIEATSGILLNGSAASNTFKLYDSSSILSAAFPISILGTGGNNVFSLYDSSYMRSTSWNGVNIEQNSHNNKFYLHDNSHIDVGEANGIAAKIGFDIDSDTNIISLDGNSQIRLTNDNSIGVFFGNVADHNTLTLAGNSDIILTEAVSGSRLLTRGVVVEGYDTTINMQDNSSINIQMYGDEEAAVGIEVSGDADDTDINISESAEIFLSATNSSGILVKDTADGTTITITDGNASSYLSNIRAYGIDGAAIRLNNSGTGPYTTTINLNDGAGIVGREHAIIVSGKSRALINIDGRDADGNASLVRVRSSVGDAAIQMGTYDDVLTISGTVIIEDDIVGGTAANDQLNMANAILDMNNSYIDDVANINISGVTTLTNAKIDVNDQIVTIANNADVTFAGDNFRIGSTNNQNAGNAYNALTIDTKNNINLTMRDDSIIETLGDQGLGVNVANSDNLDISLNNTARIISYNAAAVAFDNYSQDNTITLNDNSVISGEENGIASTGSRTKIYVNDSATITASDDLGSAIHVGDNSSRIYLRDQVTVSATGSIGAPAGTTNAMAISLGGAANSSILTIEGGTVSGDYAAIRVVGDNNIITLDARRNDVSLLAESGTAISFYNGYSNDSSGNRVNVIDVSGDGNELVINGDITSYGDDMLGLGGITTTFTGAGALPSTLTFFGTNFIDFDNIGLAGDANITMGGSFVTNRTIIEDNNNTLTLMGDAAIVANTAKPNIFVYDAFNTTINMAGTSALYSNVSGAEGISVIPQNTEFGSQKSIQNRVKLLLNEGFYGVTGTNVTEAVAAINTLLGSNLSRPVTAADFNNFNTLSTLIATAIDDKYDDDNGNKMAVFLAEVQLDSGLSSGNPLKLFTLPDHDITINLIDSANILTSGDFSEGILLAFAAGAEITLDNSALISTSGDGSEAIDLLNSYNTNITLNGNAKILTTGSTETYNTSHGISLEDDFDTTITLNGNSYIKTTGADANVIYLNDSRNATITLNGANTVLIAEGAATHAVKLENARYTSININAGTIYSKFGDGINIAGGYDNVFTLTNSAAVESNAAAGISVVDGLTTRITVTDSDIIGATTAIDGSQADSLRVTLISSGPPDEDGPLLNIVGNGGTAILFGDGNDRLTISGIGHYIGGDVIAGAGTDRLTFYNTLMSLNDSSPFIGFERLFLAGGATVSLNQNTAFEDIRLNRNDADYANNLYLSDTAHVRDLTDSAVLVNISGNGHSIEMSEYSYALAIDFATAFNLYETDSNTITLNDRAEISIRNNSFAVFLGNSNNNSFTLNDNASITMNASSRGFAMYGASNTVTLNDYSTINATGSQIKAFYIAGAGSTGNVITLNSITTFVVPTVAYVSGSQSYGFQITGGADDNRINIGTDASVTTNTTLLDIRGTDSIGIDIKRTGSDSVQDNIVNLSGFATVNAGYDATAIAVRGTGSFLISDNSINMSGNSRILQLGNGDAVTFEIGEDNVFAMTGNAAIITYANNSDAISLSTMDESEITLSNTSDITTFGTGAAGIRLTDSDENTITINNTAGITSTLDRAISATSVGGVTTNDIVLNSGTSLSGVVGIEADANSHLNVTLDGSTAAVSVTGTGGTAISLGDQNDYLRLIGTVNFDGDVLGGGGTDTLATQNLNLSLTAGSEISGFESFIAVGNNSFDIAGDVLQTLNLAVAGNNTINLLGTGKIDTNSIGASGIAGDDSSFNEINISETASIVTRANESYGIEITDGSHNDITLSDSGSIKTYGSSAAGIFLDTTENNDIILNDNSAIETAGMFAHGVFVYGSTDNDITLNGNANIKVDGDSATGIMLALNSNNNRVILNGASSVEAHGTTSNSYGVRFNGSNSNALTLNGTSAIYSEYGNAVALSGANNSIITLNGGDITAAAGIGIEATSGSATDNTIIVQNSSTISGETAIRADANSALDITLDGSGAAVEVEGTDGVSLDLGGLSDTVLLRGAVTSKGNMLGGAGTDTLNFISSTLTMNANDEISGFENINFTGNNVVTGDVNATGSTFRVNSASSLNIDGELTNSNTNFIVNGALSLDTLTIGSGGFLRGNSNITANTTNIASGGTVAPGNSIGVTNITGDLNFLNGSALDIELDGNNADQVNVDGNITIDSGATLNFIPLSAFTGSNFDFLTSTGAITGTFGTVNYNGSTVSLLYTSTAASISSTLSLLSYNPSALNAKVESTIANGLLFGDTIASEASEGALRKGNYNWFRSLYRYTDSATQGSYAGGNAHTYGIALGSERPMSENVKIGYSVANINSNSNINGALGNHQNNGVFGSLYGTYTAPVSNMDTFITTGFLAGHQDTDSKRLVSNSGVSSFAKSDSQDLTAGGFVQLGARLPISAGWDIMPRTSLTYLNSGMDGFSETQGGAANVKINNANFATLKTAQSVSLMNKQGLAITDAIKAYPNVELGLSQERVVGNRDISGTFSTNTNFTTTLQEKDRNFVNVEVGMKFTISDDATAFISYQGSLNSDEKRTNIKAGASLKF